MNEKQGLNNKINYVVESNQTSPTEPALKLPPSESEANPRGARDKFEMIVFCDEFGQRRNFDPQWIYVENMLDKLGDPKYPWIDEIGWH